jgi:hypothetical protein
MDDLTVTYRNISDESRVERDGTVSNWKRFDFFIGKHGPFTERIARDTYTDAELQSRITRLKAMVQNAPK